jgi:predicted nucleic acid-binding protein
MAASRSAVTGYGLWTFLAIIALVILATLAALTVFAVMPPLSPFSLPSLALISGAAATVSKVQGGEAKTKRNADSPHVVVDTLNVAHWLRRADAQAQGVAESRRPLTPAEVAAAVERLAPALKARFPGTVTFVLKDRDRALNDDATRAVYAAAAKRAGVVIAIAERYADPPASEAGRRAAAKGPRAREEHAAAGRDDFYTALLAWRYRCPVVTNDALRDFGEFRALIPPFHTVEYAYWRDRPHRDYIRPDSAAYVPVRRPLRLRPAEVFPDLAAGEK